MLSRGGMCSISAEYRWFRLYGEGGIAYRYCGVPAQNTRTLHNAARCGAPARMARKRVDKAIAYIAPRV